MVSERQKQFDKLKLELSQFLGEDACGTFQFCRYCDKRVENPCEVAEKRHNDLKNEKPKKQSKKTVIINGKQAQFRATVVDKK